MRLNSAASGGDSLKEKLDKMYQEFRQMRFPPADSDERIRRLHDLLILYDSDVAAAITEVLKGPRRFFRLSHYEGLREKPQLEKRIDDVLKAEPYDSQIAYVARQYAERYNHMKKMNAMAKLLSKADPQ